MRNITAFIAFCNNKCANIDKSDSGDIIHGMKNKYINRFLASMPHNVKAEFEFMDIVMEIMTMADEKNAEQMKKAQKTLREIGRLAPRVQAIWLGELMAMIGMIAYNQIDSESHARAAMFVYPAMLIATIYNCLLMDKMDKKKDIFTRQMKDINNNQR